MRDGQPERKEKSRWESREGWIIPDNTEAGVLTFLPSSRTYGEFLHLFPIWFDGLKLSMKIYLGRTKRLLEELPC